MTPCLALLCATLVTTANPAKAPADLTHHRILVVRPDGLIQSGEGQPEGSIRTLRGQAEGEVVLEKLPPPQGRYLVIDDRPGPLTLVPGEKVLLKLPAGRQIATAAVYPEGLLKLTPYENPTMVWATALKKGTVGLVLVPRRR